MYVQYALLVLGNGSSILLCSFHKYLKMSVFVFFCFSWSSDIMPSLFCAYSGFVRECLRIIFYSLILLNYFNSIFNLLYCILWQCESKSGLYMLHGNSSSEPPLQSRSYAKHFVLYSFYKVHCFIHWINTFPRNLRIKKKKKAAFPDLFLLSSRLIFCLLILYFFKNIWQYSKVNV